MNAVLAELMTSGVSVSTANTATNPLDVVKVRLQLQKTVALDGVRAPGMVAIGTGIVRDEGVLALWKGMGPSLARGLFHGGLRLGLYTPIKNAVVASWPAQKTANSTGSGMLYQKILAGSLSGGIASAITSPMELVKTRLQAASSESLTASAVIRGVVEKQGVAGLWNGAMPGLVRAAVLTAAQCATYDEVKTTVKSVTGWTDHAGTHLLSSMIAGLVTTTATNPLDVIKTHMFMGRDKQKLGIFQTASKVLRNDGVMGFMKGWSASYARLGPHTVIMFLTAEQLRPLMGLKGL